MTRGDENTTKGSGPPMDARRSKVGRLIASYGLDGYGDELERRWTAEDDRASLRELADSFNRRLLQAALTDAGASPLGGEVENTHRLLTADDVSGGEKTEAKRSLEQAGVDVDTVERDFVSHQAMHTYLTKYRGAEAPEADTDRLEGAKSTLSRLQSRVQAVTRRTVDGLRRTDRLALGEFDVVVEVKVYCEDCGRQFGVLDLLATGECECEHAA